MKSRPLSCFTVVTLSIGLMAPAQFSAQDTAQDPRKHHHYKLIDMGTFGGHSIKTPCRTPSCSSRATRIIPASRAAITTWWKAQQLPKIQPG